jgi:hypothetical protein
VTASRTGLSFPPPNRTRAPTPRKRSPPGCVPKHPAWLRTLLFLPHWVAEPAATVAPRACGPPHPRGPRSWPPVQGTTWALESLERLMG